MPRTTLIAVLSLDGAWRTGQASFAVLRRLLALAGNGSGPLWTDIPELRRHRIPGLRWIETDLLATEMRASRKGGPYLLLGTPETHAACLADASSAPHLLILRQPEIVVGPRRATFAAGFIPPDGRRVRFRLLSGRATADGYLCHYGPVSLAKKSSPR